MDLSAHLYMSYLHKQRSLGEELTDVLNETQVLTRDSTCHGDFFFTYLAGLKTGCMHVAQCLFLLEDWKVNSALLCKLPKSRQYHLTPQRE